MSGNDTARDWAWIPVRQIAQIIRGVSYDKREARETPAKGLTPILRATNIQENTLVLDKDLVYVPEKCVSDEQKLKPGDIVVATSSGSKHLVGKTAQIKSEWNGSFGAFCAAVRPAPGIDSRYLGYYFDSPAYKRHISSKAIGVNINNLRRGDLEDLEVPIASMGEQQCIVAEIERQFSRLDEAVASLKRTKANLKRYKAAVLKAAVEGKLSEEWRRQHPDVEPASKLLERILVERRAKWRGKGKYKEPCEPDANNLGPIPNSWTWVSLEQVCPRFVDSAHRTPRYGQIGVPALGPRDVVGGKLNVTDARLVDEIEYTIQTERHVPEAGDIAYSRELSLGWGAILPPNIRVCLSQGMCLFRPHEAVNSRYFMIVVNGPHGRRQAERAATGSAHPHVNLGDIKKYSVPLPPTPEQEQIVAEVERRLSVIEELEATAEANLSRADRLRQAILSQAFNGKLLSNGARG